MTTTLPATLAEYTDAQLRDFYSASEGEEWHALIIAEMARRDAVTETARHDPRTAQRREWELMAHAQFLEAEHATRGVLLSKRGIAAGINPWTLWSGPASRVEAYASEELREWFDAHKRLDISTFQRQASGERRAWTDRHDMEARRNDQLDRDAASGVRRIASEGQEGARARDVGARDIVPGPAAARGAQDSPGTGSAAGPGRPVRTGGRVNITDTGIAAKRADIHRRAEKARALAPGESVPDDDDTAGVIVPGTAEGGSQGAVALRSGVVVYDPEPPEPVDGAELLGHLAGYFGTYIAFPSVGAHVAVSLFNAAAAARHRDDSGLGPPIWRALPLLGVTSKNNKSGKSTVLDCTRYVQQVQRPVKITGRALAHKLGRKHEAVVIDEAKLIFGAGAASRDVQSVFLACYTAGGTWSYSRGNADVDIPCFGPVCYAAKDELITGTGEQLIDLFDRTIFVRMRRGTRLMPQTDEAAEDDGRLLGLSLIEWTNSVRGQLIARSKELARLDFEASQAAADDGREVDGRRPQIWRPLLAVADVAGGPWPALARQALRELTEGAATLETAARMGELRQRAQRWAPVGFLNGAAPAADDDYEDGEDEF